MRNAGLEETQAGIKIAREKSQSPQIYRWHHPYGRKWRGAKNLLMKVKEESEKFGLKLNIQKIRSWCPVPSLQGKQIGKQWKQWQTIFLGSKITADGDCSHEIKRRLLLGRKDMINQDSILKSRDITMPTKVCLVKAMVFLVVMYGCESWATKKSEHWRIDAFEL